MCSKENSKLVKSLKAEVNEILLAIVGLPRVVRSTVLHRHVSGSTAFGWKWASGWGPTTSPYPLPFLSVERLIFFRARKSGITNSA
jgi:hypothetical protein